MSSGQRVLVIDGLSETEEVLKAVFEPRGLQVDRIRSDAESPLVPCRRRPDIVVLHADDEIAEPSNGDDWTSVPRIVIGSARLPATHDDPPSRSLRNPFHYGELIQAIERLLV